VSDEMKEQKPMTSAMWCEKWERENDRANSLQAKVEKLETEIKVWKNVSNRWIERATKAESEVEAQAKGIERLTKVVVRAKYLISIVPDNDAWFDDAEAALVRIQEIT